MATKRSVVNDDTRRAAKSSTPARRICTVRTSGLTISWATRRLVTTTRPVTRTRRSQAGRPGRSGAVGTGLTVVVFAIRNRGRRLEPPGSPLQSIGLSAVGSRGLGERRIGLLEAQEGHAHVGRRGRPAVVDLRVVALDDVRQRLREGGDNGR